MRIQKLLLSITLVIICISESYSQSRYDGGRSSFTLGIANNFQYMKLDKGFGLTKDNDLLLPKIRFGYEIPIKNSTIRLEAGYHMLPNVYLFDSLTYINNKNETIHQFDTSGVRSDNFKIGFHFKNFIKSEPIGFYIQFGISSNLIVNKGLHSVYDVFNAPQGNYMRINSVHRKIHKLKAIGEIELSFGRTFPLKEKLCIDVGLECNVLLARLNPSNLTHNFLSPKTLMWANTRTIFGSSLFEIYVNIQLFN